MNRLLTSLLLSLFFFTFVKGQTVEGYVYESNNQGYIGGVKVTLVEEGSGPVVKSLYSDDEGYFTFKLPPKGKYRLMAYKELYAPASTLLDRSQLTRGKLFTKIGMNRVEGYLLELELVTKSINDPDQLRPLRRVNIEVYNNTYNEVLYDLKAINASKFEMNLAQGNHYTLLIRKEGYISRRIEAYVDIEGCILCFDGMDQVNAKMVEAINRGDELGVLNAKIEMRTSEEGKTVASKSLYFDFASSDLRPESTSLLDEIIEILEDNASLTIEIGAHTDSRGEASANLALSERRAQSVVDYLIANSDVQEERLLARGYGESQLLNRCGEGVNCTEEEHQANRRTEMKILGKTKEVNLKSLKEMKRMEEIKGRGQEEEEEALAVKDDLNLLRTLAEIGLKRKPVEVKEAPKQAEKKSMKEMLFAIDPAAQEAYEKEQILRAKEKQRQKELMAMLNNNKPVEPAIDEYGQRLEGYTIVIKENYGGPIVPSDKIFQQHEIVYRYYEDYKNFLYTVNKYASKEEAELALQRSFKSLYPKAFIVEFKKGHTVRSKFFKQTGGR